MGRIFIYHMEEKYKPQKNYNSDAALDICARLEYKITLKPKTRTVIPTGIRLSLPPFWKAILTPKSGLASEYGLTLQNSPGIIDSGYTGEIKAIIVNHGSSPFVIEDGDRIAQMSFHRIPRVEIINLLDNNNPRIDTDRGPNGLGSSGTSNFNT
jgi:dUTP pyrophosphatase